MLKSFLLPLGLLIGAVIGAGIFSLPFVFSKAGIILAIFYLFSMGLVAYVIHVMYADIMLKTYATPHRFPGYAKIYLGKSGEILATAVIFTTLILTMTVYLILSASFVSLVFTTLSTPVKILLFWALGSIPIFFTVKRTALLEVFTTTITILAIGAIFFFGISSGAGKIGALPKIDWGFFLFPFGPVLFSLLGEAAIPPIVVYCKNSAMDISRVKRVIFWGAFLPATLYIMFSLGIILASPEVSQDGISGLTGHVPYFILLTLGVFGFVSLLDSYIAIGTDIRKIMEYDWKWSKLSAGLIIIPLPLFLYALGLQNFIKLVGLVGGVLFGLWGMLILLMWRRASAKTEPILIKKFPPLLSGLLFLIFIGGIVYEIIASLG